MRCPPFQRGPTSLALGALLVVALAAGVAQPIVRLDPDAPTPVAAPHACGACSERPLLARSDDPPALFVANRSWRAEAAPDRRTDPPARPLLRAALAAHPNAARAGRPAVPRAQPTLGLVVPACHAQARWSLAHATSTSPA